MEKTKLIDRMDRWIDSRNLSFHNDNIDRILLHPNDRAEAHHVTNGDLVYRGLPIKFLAEQ